MSDIKIRDEEYIRTQDGREMKMSMLKALTKAAVLKTQRAAFKNMDPKDKSKFYYKAYEILNRHTFEDKKEPLVQMGLSPFTFMQETLMIGGFQTTYGELFSRLHQAIFEAEATFDPEAK